MGYMMIYIYIETLHSKWDISGIIYGVLVGQYWDNIDKMEYQEWWRIWNISGL